MAGDTNGFEGGTDTSAITTGNSGGLSGTAFSAVSSMTYSATQAAHGSLAGRTAGSTIGYAEHSLSGTGVRYARAYVYVGGLTQFMHLKMASGNDSYLLQTDGTTITFFAEVAGSFTTLGTTSTTHTNQWMRIEMSGTTGTGGAGEARIYVGDSSTAAATLTGSAARSSGTWSAV